MESPHLSQISDEEDNKSDVSIVTNTTMQTLDDRSPIVFPVLHKYKTEKEETPVLIEGLCSPIIPVLSTKFLMKSLKRASQSSVEDDEDSDGSLVSESIISTQTQKDKQIYKAMKFTSFQAGTTKDTIFNRKTTISETQDRKISTSEQSDIDIEQEERYDHVTLPSTNENDKDAVTDSQETYMPDGEPNQGLNHLTLLSKPASGKVAVTDSQETYMPEIEPNQRHNHVTLPSTNENVEDAVTDSQETYMPEIEPNKRYNNATLMSKNENDEVTVLDSQETYMPEIKPNKRHNNATLMSKNENDEFTVLDSQETYMPEIEQNKRHNNATLMSKNKNDEVRGSDSQETCMLDGENQMRNVVIKDRQTERSPNIPIMIGNGSMSYEMRAFTNSVNNTGRLNRLVGNYISVDKETSYNEMLLSKGCKRIEDQITPPNNSLEYHLNSKISNEILSPKSTLHFYPVSNSESGLPHLTEKDINMICKTSDMEGEKNNDETQPLAKKRKSEFHEKKNESDSWEITEDDHCMNDKKVTSFHDPWMANPSIPANKGTTNTVLSPDKGETTLNSLKNMKSSASSKKSSNRSVLNADGLLDFSQETLPPTDDISGKTNSDENNQNNTIIPTSFDGSQCLFQDTQSSISTTLPTFASSEAQEPDIIGNSSHQLQNEKSLARYQNQFVRHKDQNEMEMSHSQLEYDNIPVQTKVSDDLSGRVKSPLRLGGRVSLHSSPQTTSFVSMEVWDDTTKVCHSKIRKTKDTSDDMDVCSDVEPSQMLLMSTQDEKAGTENVLSSQTSSMSSLGDISDSDVNYKTKEQQILNKIERMQMKIQKKLTTASKKTLTCDIEITKQQIQAIKGILVKIAERHKLERNKLSLEVKRSSKSKAEKSEIREHLIELSERQKILFKLFQRHKEISRIIREDVKLNECLASALTNEEGKSTILPQSGKVKPAIPTKVKVKPTQVVKSCDKGSFSSGRTLPTASGKCKTTPKTKKVVLEDKTKKIIATAGRDEIGHSFCKKGTATFRKDDPSHLIARHKTIKTGQTETISNKKNLQGEAGQENDNNLTISLNGTQELFCNMEEEMDTGSYKFKDCSSGQSLTTISSSVKTSTNCPVGIKANATSSNYHTTMSANYGVATSSNNSTGIKDIITGSNHTAGIKTIPQLCEENWLKAMGLFTSTKVADDPKRKTDTTKLVQVDNTQTSSKLTSDPCKTLSNERSNAIIVVDKDPVISGKSNSSMSELEKDLNYSINAKDARQAAYNSKPMQTNAKSCVPLLTDVASRSSAVYLSVPVDTNGTSLGRNTHTISSKIAKNDRKQLENQLNRNTVSSSREPSKTVAPICLPGRISSTKNSAPSSQERKKKQCKPIIPNSQKNIITLDPDSDDEKDPHSQQEVLKRVMEDAMRIINDRSVGNLKRPQIGIDNGWQAKQSKMYMAEPLMPINPDIFKSPPLYQTGGGARDISPSIASFTTFRSAFPDQSPETCRQPQYQSEDLGLFDGLKYPPLIMLIDKQIIRPRKHILSVYARDKEFKASLTEDGCIESLGGELFQTPVKWLAAILGKPVPDVKKSKAYKEIHYRGRPLMTYVEDPTPLPDDDENSEEVTSEQIERIDEIKPTSQGSMQKLKTLLNNCKIKLLDDRDLVSDNDLPENFWTEDFSKVRLSYEMWKEVDNWD